MWFRLMCLFVFADVTMKERVELNNNGRSIESHCKLFQNNKWEPRYIVCKLQIDLEDPLLTIYKNRKDRQKNKPKQSLLLRNYIGFEKSFPLKNKNQTLTVITKENNVVLAFHLPETLLQWETWFKNVGGQSTTHYMQLLKFPNQQDNASFINKEVRCHLHDSRLAIVYGYPAETLLYCEVSAANISTDHMNHRVIITPHDGSSEFLLCCPSIEQFSKFLKKANEDDGSLNLYLNKKSAEGVWLQNVSSLAFREKMAINHRQIGNRTRKHQDSISGLSGTFSGWFNLMSPATPSINQSEIFSSRAAINTLGLRNPGMKTPVGSLKFLNGLLPEVTSPSPPVIAPPPETPIIFSSQTNIVTTSESPVLSTSDNSPYLGSESKQRSTSLPEYVNVSHMIRPPPPLPEEPKTMSHHEVIHRKASTMTTPARDSPRFSNCGEHKDFLPNQIPTKGRSMMDFSTLPYEETGSRYESWRRAKKFISAFSQKSHQDLYKSVPKIGKRKASSTSALTYHTNEHLKSKTSLASTSSSSEIDGLPPPALNVAVSNPPPPLLPRKDKIQEPENIPAGLVRLREEGSLKLRGGVNIALARRLAAGINGSFTKYDGDRGTTHVYPQTPEEKERKIAEFIEERKKLASARKAESPDLSDDPLARVVSKERDKIRLMERRASSVSFNKANSVQVAHLNEIQKRALASVTIINRDNSQSDSSSSSSESLSSDARSKISIKKRSNSPPHTIAPSFLPKPLSQRTLTLPKQSSSSMDSLNSQQTTKTMSSVRLPTRILVNQSSSSEESSGKSQDYFEHNIGPKTSNSTTTTTTSHQTLGRQDSRRMSEGQGSNSSDAMVQARKGYFRKNNKTRRSNRHLDETSTSP
uniref:PH domain-containing protein n=1 Tax=Caenorhabditis tropicalis TaxID=1561998 RepID=A0A1I7TJR8_9PELO